MSEQTRNIIVPTVGRVVWFYPHPDAEAQAAIVAKVHSPGMVNLCVIEHIGTTSGRTSVPLLQEGDLIPIHAHCTWMPYQIGQAKKDAAS